MMEINLKDKLRTLRQQKDVTQEALANHLGITPQSISKWERGEGFPDITLLPRIAFYFGVTVDELLCVDQVKIEETIKEYQRQGEIYKHSGENEKNRALWEKAYSEFPDDCRIMNELMCALNRDGIFPCAAEKADRIIALGEAILRKSTDAEQRENAVYWLCLTYAGMGNKEKALYYADMGGNLYVTREALKTEILDGAEGVCACQAYILKLIQQVVLKAITLAKKFQFPHEEKIEAYQFAIDLINRLFSDGNVGLYAFDLSWCSCDIAAEYAEMNDRENALKALEESRRYAVIDATSDEVVYTAPLINRIRIKKLYTKRNYKGNACNMILQNMEDKRFDSIRNEDTFKKILSDLKKYAE